MSQAASTHSRPPGPTHTQQPEMSRVQAFDSCTAAIKTAFSIPHILEAIVAEYLGPDRLPEDRDWNFDAIAYSNALSSLKLVASPFAIMVCESQFHTVPLSLFRRLMASKCPNFRVIRLIRHVYFTRFEPDSEQTLKALLQDKYHSDASLPNEVGLEFIRELCPRLRRVYARNLGGHVLDKADWMVDFTTTPPTLGVWAILNPSRLGEPLPPILNTKRYNCEIHLSVRLGGHSLDSVTYPKAERWLSSAQALDPRIACFQFELPSTDVREILRFMDRRKAAGADTVTHLGVSHYPMLRVPLFNALCMSASTVTDLHIGYSADYDPANMMPLSGFGAAIRTVARYMPNLQRLNLFFSGESSEGEEWDVGYLTPESLPRRDWLDEFGVTIVMDESAFPCDSNTMTLVRIMAACVKYDPGRPAQDEAQDGFEHPSGLFIDRAVDEPTPIEPIGPYFTREYHQLVRLPPARKHNVLAADWVKLGLAPGLWPKLEPDDLVFDENDQPISPPAYDGPTWCFVDIDIPMSHSVYDGPIWSFDDIDIPMPPHAFYSPISSFDDIHIPM